jgi:endogenous inhibitor of DNA gyrase (YacG/DUF329 family)
MIASRRRDQVCAVCAQPLPRERQRRTGRRRRFCSDRCKQAAFRNRKAEILVAAHPTPGALRNAENSGVGSTPSAARKRGRASHVELLGGGHGMSSAGYGLDPTTVRNIIDAEVGPSRSLKR